MDAFDATSGALTPAATTPARGQLRQKLSTLLALGRKVDTQDPAQVRQTAEQLTSELFFKPLLAEMRKTPFGRDFATAGLGESAFGDQLDQRLADCASAAARGVVDRVMERIAPPQTPATRPTTTTTSLAQDLTA